MLTSVWAIALTVTLQGSAPTPTPTPTPTKAAAATTDDQPLTHLFQNLVHDLAALPSLRTARILGIGSTITLATRPSDADIDARILAGGTTRITRLGGIAGDGWLQAAVALTTYGIGAAGHHAKVAHIGSDLIRAQVLNGVLTNGLKLAVRRERPTGGPRSFPSGHTSAAFATAAVIDGHYGWKAGLPMYALAGFVGWSRVRDRDHWLSDIIFGGTIGIIAGRTTSSTHRTSTWSVTPSRTAGGFAIYVTRIGR